MLINRGQMHLLALAWVALCSVFMITPAVQGSQLVASFTGDEIPASAGRIPCVDDQHGVKFRLLPPACQTGSSYPSLRQPCDRHAPAVICRRGGTGANLTPTFGQALASLTNVSLPASASAVRITFKSSLVCGPDHCPSPKSSPIILSVTDVGRTRSAAELRLNEQQLRSGEASIVLPPRDASSRDVDIAVIIAGPVNFQLLTIEVYALD